MTTLGKQLMHRIDIVLPFYNPKPDWEIHVLEAMADLQLYFRDIAELRFIFVNDGTDESCFSPEIQKALADAAPGFLYLSYHPNHGKGYCLRYGVSHADTSDFVFYTDGDFPFGWKGIADAWEKLEQGADIVMGERNSTYSEALCPCRKMLSRGVRMMNRLLLGLPDRYLDTQAGLKGFNRKGRAVFLATCTDTFLFDTEFILLAWRSKLKIDTVPIFLRSGLHFSRMGFSVMARELRHFFRILWQSRILRRRLPEFER